MSGGRDSGSRRSQSLEREFDLEGVDTVHHQIEICRSKAGIMPDEPLVLHRFEVRRYRQNYST